MPCVPYNRAGLYHEEGRATIYQRPRVGLPAGHSAGMASISTPCQISRSLVSALEHVGKHPCGADRRQDRPARSLLKSSMPQLGSAHPGSIKAFDSLAPRATYCGENLGRFDREIFRIEAGHANAILGLSVEEIEAFHSGLNEPSAPGISLD